MAEQPAQQALSIFQLTIPDLTALAAQYMPCFRHGGLLVQDARVLALASPVFLMLELPGVEEILACSGRIASLLRHDNQATTYTVQFLQDGIVIDTRIRKLIAKKGPGMPGFGESAFS